MKIIIDIPKYVYDTIVANKGYIIDCDNENVGMAIKNGTPLLEDNYCRNCKFFGEQIFGGDYYYRCKNTESEYFMCSLSAIACKEFELKR